MPQGPEHVEAALQLIQSASDTIGKLGGVDESWRTEAVTKLASIAALLQTTMDRFFLKTKVCLPFARKCEEEARKLDVLLVEVRQGEHGGTPLSQEETQQRLTAALQALEKAAKTLDERSLMQGMAIT